jgi:hypothetical protein
VGHRKLGRKTKLLGTKVNQGTVTLFKDLVPEVELNNRTLLRTSQETYVRSAICSCAVWFWSFKSWRLRASHSRRGGSPKSRAEACGKFHTPDALLIKKSAPFTTCLYVLHVIPTATANNIKRLVMGQRCLLRGGNWVFKLYTHKVQKGSESLSLDSGRGGAVSIQANLCEIYGGQSGTRTGIYPSTSAFPCQYHDTNMTDWLTN